MSRTFIISLVLCAACGRPAGRADRPAKVIDVHLHAYPDGYDFAQRGPGPGRQPLQPSADFEAHFEETLAVMDAHNVVVGVVSGPVQTVLEWESEAPGRFIGGPLFGEPGSDWFGGPLELEELRALYESQRLGVMGEVSGQYLGLAPGDSALEPFFALAEELDIPVGIHMSGGGGREPRFQVRLGNPLELEPVLHRHPRLRIYMMHAGMPFLAETVAILRRYPQVYVDVARIGWIRPIPQEAFHEYLHGLIRAGLGERIMFGSDQGPWPQSLELAILSIETADFLSLEQKRDIFCRNAARFFRLDPVVCEP